MRCELCNEELNTSEIIKCIVDNEIKNICRACIIRNNAIVIEPKKIKAEFYTRERKSAAFTLEDLWRRYKERKKEEEKLNEEIGEELVATTLAEIEEKREKGFLTKIFDVFKGREKDSEENKDKNKDKDGS